ncbi:hypothetical protein BDV12DRAFT_208593 [Aspergillus spectabilis]
MPALFDLHCVLRPSNVLPSINLVETLADSGQIDVWSMVPSLVDELGETPEVLSKLRPSKFICASGGPVSPISARKVNEVIRVLNLTGTTEGLFIGNLVVPREDWFCWPLFQGIFHTFPEKQEINFKNLYMKHPTKPNLWAFKGRSDDLVAEAFITTHPAIAGCLVFGTGKPQARLLTKLKDPSAPKIDELLDSIWKTPFFRTDKGTVKRPATLKLYDDYIDQFYSTRSDDDDEGTHIRKILATSLSDSQQISADEDLFALGLDSLGVFAAVKAVRAATGLGDCIGPRHIYANPTISKLSLAIALLAGEKEKATTATTSGKPFNEGVARMKQMIAQHQARKSFALNALDYVNPNHGMGLMLYIPLREGVSFEHAFENLQEGLNRTFDLIPALGGKMMHCSEEMIGYTKGDLCVTIPPLSKAASARNRLVFKDLSRQLPSFQELRDASFPPSAHTDGLANFVAGGCILEVDLNHCCLDDIGAMVTLRAWAENCRCLQGDKLATCNWYNPESFNHSLPEIIHEQEGWGRPLDETDPGTWGFLPFFPPDDEANRSSSPVDEAFAETALLPRPISPLHSIWPLHKAERPLRTTLFTINPDKNQDVLLESSTSDFKPSISDIVQALFWRAAIRARHRTDALLLLPPPETYMGSMLIMSRCTMSLATLVSPATSLAEVAQGLRNSASRITPRLVHDAFTILQSLPDHSRLGLEHMHAMISKMMMFPFSEISFGDQLFGNCGMPETLRPQLERGNGRFRFLVVFPLNADGGVELVLGTHPEELEMLLADGESMKYAVLSDTCC